MHPSGTDSGDYHLILNILNTRAKKIRRNVFVLIYFLIIVVASVVLVAYNIKNTSNSPLANTISAAIDARNNEKFASIVRQSFDEEFDKSEKPTNKPVEKSSHKDIEKKVNSMKDGEVDKNLAINWLYHLRPIKSTSEKIAESIASLLISLSIFMFIGFVMRVLLVFIKYYMQLGTDYENQQMAFMISKGDHDNFSKNLTLLREHNINFEKTPSMPQEKIIMKLIDVVKNAKENIDKSRSKP